RMRNVNNFKYGEHTFLLTLMLLSNSIENYWTEIYNSTSSCHLNARGWTLYYSSVRINYLMLYSANLRIHYILHTRIHYAKGIQFNCLFHFQLLQVFTKKELFPHHVNYWSLLLGAVVTAHAVVVRLIFTAGVAMMILMKIFGLVVLILLTPWSVVLILLTPWSLVVPRRIAKDCACCYDDLDEDIRARLRLASSRVVLRLLTGKFNFGIIVMGILSVLKAKTDYLWIFTKLCLSHQRQRCCKMDFLQSLQTLETIMKCITVIVWRLI
ncbi:hypothetical protein L9F63_011957, partial [Diploptera punctata]